MSTLGTHKHHYAPDADELRVAQAILRSLISRMATEQANLLGIGWVAAPDAPCTYEGVARTFQRCLDQGEPFPVSSLHCERTVYGSPAANQAFRFWHDASHVAYSLRFSCRDELQLAEIHDTAIKRSGVDPRSLAYRLFRADTWGQAYFAYAVGGFVRDQLRFAVNACVHGIDTAVAVEVAEREATGDA